MQNEMRFSNFSLLLVLTTLLTLSFSPILGTPKTAPRKKIWEKVLQTLNQPANDSGVSFTHKTGQDLLVLHQQEMESIEKKWTQNSSVVSPDPKKTREQKNTFFHEQIKELNQSVYSALEKSKAPATHVINYQKEAKKVFDRIGNDPVVGPLAVFDFQGGDQIGFCFGRALLIHYRLLKEGVPQKDIVKVFNLGDLLVKKTLWKFHVAVFVRDSKDGWIVVDPLQEDLLPYQEWLKRNLDYEVKTPLSRARFYLTPPTKFLPAFESYEWKLLQDPVLKPFFDKVPLSLLE